MSRALGVRAGWPAAPHLQEPPQRQRQLLGAVDPDVAPFCGGLGGASPCGMDFGFPGLLRPAHGFSVTPGGGRASPRVCCHVDAPALWAAGTASPSRKSDRKTLPGTQGPAGQGGAVFGRSTELGPPGL